VDNGSRTVKVGVRVVTRRVCKDCAISISADDSAELHSGTHHGTLLEDSKESGILSGGRLHNRHAILHDDVVAAPSIHTAHVLGACLQACLRGRPCRPPNLRGSQLSTRVPISHPAARSRPMPPMLPSCNIVSTNGECVTNFRLEDAEASARIMEIAQ
jgi:hypothetical protein